MGEALLASGQTEERLILGEQQKLKKDEGEEGLCGICN